MPTTEDALSSRSASISSPTEDRFSDLISSSSLPDDYEPLITSSYELDMNINDDTTLLLTGLDHSTVKININIVQYDKVLIDVIARTFWTIFELKTEIATRSNLVNRDKCHLFIQCKNEWVHLSDACTLVNFINVLGPNEFKLVDSLEVVIREYNDFYECLQSSKYIFSEPKISLINVFMIFENDKFNFTGKSLYNRNGMKIGDTNVMIYKLMNEFNVIELYLDSDFEPVIDTEYGLMAGISTTLDAVLESITRGNRIPKSAYITNMNKSMPFLSIEGIATLLNPKKGDKNILISVEASKEVPLLLKVSDEMIVSQLVTLIYKSIQTNGKNKFIKYYLKHGDMFLLDPNRKLKHYNIQNASRLELAICISLSEDALLIQEIKSPISRKSISVITAIILALISILLSFILNAMDQVNR